MRLADRPLTADEARRIAAWSYDPPFDLYDVSGEGTIALGTTRDEGGHGYYPVLAGNDVVGFVCFGP